MATKAVLGRGAEFRRGDTGAATNFVKVDGFVGLDWSGRGRAALDATEHDSPDGFNESIPGNADPGSWNASFHWDPTNTSQGYLEDDLDNGTVRYWQIYVNGKTYTTRGFVTAIEPTTPFDNKLTMRVTLRLTGKYTKA